VLSLSLLETRCRSVNLPDKNKSILSLVKSPNGRLGDSGLALWLRLLRAPLAEVDLDLDAMMMWDEQ
jgi:hypothetical protein